MSFWLPLESNSEVLTKYMHELGVPSSWMIEDVLSVEPDMLKWMPQPLQALILVYPCSPKYEEHSAKEHEELSKNPVKYPDDLFYMRQFTHNACGTVALIHSIANAKNIELEDGVLKNFLAETKLKNEDERGYALDKDKNMCDVHESLALEGQTEADPNNVNHHFIALIHHNGTLYELDGRKSFPIAHGETTAETFVTDAARVCREFMELDPQETRFSILALCGAK